MEFFVLGKVHAFVGQCIVNAFLPQEAATVHTTIMLATLKKVTLSRKDIR